MVVRAGVREDAHPGDALTWIAVLKDDIAQLERRLPRSDAMPRGES